MVIPRQSSLQETGYYDGDETMDDMQKVSLFTVRDYGSSGRYRWATGILGLLCAALLMAVIGLAVLMKDTREGHLSLSLNATGLSKELELLRAENGRLVAAKDSLQQDYNRARGDRSILQAQVTREKAQQDRMLSQIRTLEDQQKAQTLRVSQLERSCSRCPAEWEVRENTCYYFPTPARVRRRGWNDAKEDCNSYGARLAVLDTLEKQIFIAGVVRTRHSEGFSYGSGYWIGLMEQTLEEGWHWMTGAALTTGYWMPGEPNDNGGQEDCAAIYPKVDPLLSWNDAPCTHPLMWICEKDATSSA